MEDISHGNHPDGEAASPQAGKCFRRLLVSSLWGEIVFIPAICITGCSPWITAHCLGTLIPGKGTQPLCKMFFAKSFWKTLFKRLFWHNPFPKTTFARLFLEKHPPSTRPSLQH